MKLGDRVRATLFMDGIERYGRILAFIDTPEPACLVEWDDPAIGNIPGSKLYAVAEWKVEVVNDVAPPDDLTPEEAVVWFDLVREQMFLDAGWRKEDLPP